MYVAAFPPLGLFRSRSIILVRKSDSLSSSVPSVTVVATTALVNPADDEDLALTLNGKKKRIKRIDFETAFTTLHLDTKQQANLFLKMGKAKKKWLEFIEISFLSDDYKTGFLQLINERFERISV